MTWENTVTFNTAWYDTVPIHTYTDVQICLIIGLWVLLVMVILRF